MKRSDLLKNAWIPVAKIIPPEDPTGKKQILIWIDRSRLSLVTPQNQARMDALRFNEQQDDDIPFIDWAWDRLYTHWMPIVSPERKLTENEEDSIRKSESVCGY